MYFLFKNEKYVKYYTYNHNNKIIYNEHNIPISKNNIIYKIINKYRDMLHYLTDIKIIPHETMEDADNGLVYKGYDSKKKLQYRYGVNYILNRKSKIFSNFLKIYEKMDRIQEIIEQGIEQEKINKNFLYASILFLELTYFIRLGKDIYLKENETVGILTLKKKNLVKEKNKDKFTINFVAKTSKEQVFECYEAEQPILYSVLNRLYNNTLDEEDYIFKTDDGQRFTERMLNLRLNQLNVSFKDFRTYGVNIILLKQIYQHLKEHQETTKNINTKELKKIINESIKNTADIIGHGKTVSKSSYIINEIEEFLYLYIDDIDLKDEETFIKYFIKRLKQQ